MTVQVELHARGTLERSVLGVVSAGVFDDGPSPDASSSDVETREQVCSLLRSFGWVEDASSALSNETVGAGQWGLLEGDACIRWWCSGVYDLPREVTIVAPPELLAGHEEELLPLARTELRMGVASASQDASAEHALVSLQARVCLPSGQDIATPLISVTEEQASVSAEVRELGVTVDGAPVRLDVANVERVIEEEDRMLASLNAPALDLRVRTEVSVSTDGLKTLAAPVSVMTVRPLTSADASGADSIAQARSLLQRATKGADPVVPPTVKVELRPYQVSGVLWLRFLRTSGLGGLLADAVGTGKTIHTITDIAHMLQSNPRGKALVIAPTSVVSNWLRELERFAPSIRTCRWTGPQRTKHMDAFQRAQVVVSTYALLIRDVQLQTPHWQYIALDEAQTIKDPSTASAQAARRLRGDFRLVLTGTPVETDPSNLWSLVDFANPGYLGSLEAFKAMFWQPNKDEEWQKAATKRLQALVQPVILRRLKSDVLPDMPPLVEIDRLVDFTEAQAFAYARLKAAFRAKIAELSRTNSKVANESALYLQALSKLRAIACDPRLVTKEPGRYTAEDSGKLQALREILRESAAAGDKVLVFSWFTQMLELSMRACDEDGLAYERIIGEDSPAARDGAIARFSNDPAVVALFIQTKAGGAGLNIQAANTVVIYDPWWNPAPEEQAIGRAYRSGQTRKVTVYRLVAAGSIEERIASKRGERTQMSAALLTGAQGGDGRPTLAEMKSLLDD